MAKHGNRSNTSRSGLGRPARGARREDRPRPRRRSRAASTRSGFGFMFAPRHHAAMKHVVPVRKELGGADDLQLPRAADEPGRAPAASSLGVSDRRYQETIAEALVGLGCERALVVCGRGRARRDLDRGQDPRDRGGRRRHRGVVRRPRGARARGRRRSSRSPAARRRRTRPSSARVLDGEPGPARDVVVLNAGAAILAAGAAEDLRAASPRAASRSTRAPRAGVLERLVETTRYPLRRMSRLEELVAAAREDVERRRQAVPIAELARPDRNRGAAPGPSTKPWSARACR